MTEKPRLPRRDAAHRVLEIGRGRVTDCILRPSHTTRQLGCRGVVQVARLPILQQL